MKLLDVVTAANGRVSGGDPYLWNSFGPNAQYMEFRDANGDGFAHCIYDTNNYEVYQVHLEIPDQDVALLWNNPKYVQQYLDECKDREMDPYIAWDAVKYQVVDYGDLMLKYLADAAERNYNNFPLTMEMPGTLGSARIAMTNSS